VPIGSHGIWRVTARTSFNDSDGLPNFGAGLGATANRRSTRLPILVEIYTYNTSLNACVGYDAEVA
jgi:hypothetical protein